MKKKRRREEKETQVKKPIRWTNLKISRRGSAMGDDAGHEYAASGRGASPRASGSSLSELYPHQEGGLRALVHENMALNRRLEAMEADLEHARQEASVESENRRVLASQLRAALMERGEERYKSVMLQQTMEQQQAEIEHLQATLRESEQTRARTEMIFSQQLEIARGGKDQPAALAPPPLMVHELSRLLTAGEADFAKLQSRCETFRSKYEGAEKEVGTLRERLRQLEERCTDLHVENSVAIDFLLRCTQGQEMQKAPESPRPRPRSHSSEGAKSTPQQAPGSPAYVVTPQASHYRLSSSSPGSPKGSPFLNKTHFNLQDVNTDQESVANHVNYLASLFEEKGIVFPVTKRNQQDGGDGDGDDSEQVVWYEIKRKADKAPLVVKLALLDDGILVVDQGSQKYVDLLETLCLQSPVE